MNTYDTPYPMDDKNIGCDLELIEWVLNRGALTTHLFHFGSGEHHCVGEQLARHGIQVWAVTASPGEHLTYIELLKKEPVMANFYRLLFTDIYCLTPEALPSFDVIALLHLGEYYTEVNAKYARNDDASLLRQMLDCLEYGGHLVLFRDYRPIAERLAAAHCEQGRLRDCGFFKRLHIYQKTNISTALIGL